MTDAGFASLMLFTGRLKSLHLSNLPRVGGNFLNKLLEHCPDLDTLILDNLPCCFEARGYDSPLVKKATQLRILIITECEVDVGAAALLFRCPNLRSLTYDGQPSVLRVAAAYWCGSFLVIAIYRFFILLSNMHQGLSSLFMTGLYADASASEMHCMNIKSYLVSIQFSLPTHLSVTLMQPPAGGGVLHGLVPGRNQRGARVPGGRAPAALAECHAAQRRAAARAAAHHGHAAPDRAAHQLLRAPSVLPCAAAQ